MREKIFIMVVVGFLVNLSALNAYAQEEEPKGQLFVIHEDVVKPSMVGKYEEATTSVVTKLKANNMTSISDGMAVPDDGEGFQKGLSPGGTEKPHTFNREQRERSHEAIGPLRWVDGTVLVLPVTRTVIGRI